MDRNIYLDNAASTPIADEVLGEMRKCFETGFGNPSSMHHPGRIAREYVETSRGEIAGFLKAKPEEIIFTGSGTEADNLAILGVAGRHINDECHIIISAIEHPAITAAAGYLAEKGIDISRIPVDNNGIVIVDEIAPLIRQDTRLISVMSANNITGVIQPIDEIGAIAHEHGVLFHTDAVQAAPYVRFDLEKQTIDLLSISAHKLHGPKGVGVLYKKNTVTLTPQIFGGGQENGLRSSTENVAGIAGLGRAVGLVRNDMASVNQRLVGFRDKIIDTLTTACPEFRLIGHRYHRLPGHICARIDGLEGKAIVLLLELDKKGIAVSSGSACSSRHVGEPSEILLAMGFDPVRARGAMRISMSKYTTADDVDTFISVFLETVATL